MLSICINSDFPIQIGPVDSRTDRLEPCDDIRCRMAERVAAAAADKRNLRTPGVEKLA